MSKQLAAIFDMDGTLADVRSIRHHVLTKPKDFDAFHAESVNVPAHEWVVDRARIMSDLGIAVIIVTARRVRWARHTAMWLALNDIPSDVMFMRGDHDHRADVDVKRDILAAIRRNFAVIHAFDDNPSVIALWESEGIPTTIVPGWSTE
jgi:phosphoglycolate phosphatase-like HAD superfamily hydrolase